MKFGIISARSKRNAPFIIGIIKPSVKIANGRASRKTIGLTKILIKVSKIEQRTSDSIVSKENPSKSELVIQSATPVAKKFVKFVINLEPILILLIIINIRINMIA